MYRREAHTITYLIMFYLENTHLCYSFYILLFSLIYFMFVKDDNIIDFHIFSILIDSEILHSRLLLSII